LKRRLTAPAFRLAGSGWYETDFKKDGDRKRNLAAKDDAPKSGAKSDAKSDAKADAKPDSRADVGETRKKPDEGKSKPETKDAKSATPSKPAGSASA